MKIILKAISRALKDTINDFSMSHIVRLVILGLYIAIVAFILGYRN